MGKAARFACILTPLVLSMLSLICLALVFAGGLNKGDTTSFYHYKIDTSEFRQKVASGTYMVQGAKLVDNLLYALEESAKKDTLQDFYNIYLWDYCSGSKGSSNGSLTVTFCSPSKSQYYFDPVQEWGLRDTLTAERYTPDSVIMPMNVFAKGVHWLFISYIISFATAALTIVVGMFAICSRVGSLVTTIVAGTATAFAFITAVSSTVLFSALVGAWSAALKPYMISLSLGSRVFALDWLAVCFSAAATLFWAISTCCCSGKSHKKRPATVVSGPGKQHGGGMTANTSYYGGGGFMSRGYQPLGDDQEQALLADAEAQNKAGGGAVGGEMHASSRSPSPLPAASAGPYKGREGAYEPFRHANV